MSSNGIVARSDLGCASPTSGGSNNQTFIRVCAYRSYAKINAVAVSNDGTLLLTGSDDSTALLWDLSQSTPTAIKLEGHKKRVSSVAFSKNGRYALTGSDDATALLWNIGQTPPVCEKTLQVGGRV